MLPCGGSGGDGGSPESTVVEQHVDLNGRVPPGVEDLTGADLVDERHRWWMVPEVSPATSEVDDST